METGTKIEDAEDPSKVPWTTEQRMFLNEYAAANPGKADGISWSQFNKYFKDFYDYHTASACRRYGSSGRKNPQFTLGHT